MIICFSGSILQSVNNIENLRRSIPGEPEVDYPIFRTPPDTAFSCLSRDTGKMNNKNPLQSNQQIFDKRKVLTK